MNAIGQSTLDYCEPALHCVGSVSMDSIESEERSQEFPNGGVAIEILIVALNDGDLVKLQPGQADSFIFPWFSGQRPEQTAAQAIELLGLQPLMLHSTSWRHRNDEVVLTYVTVVGPDDELPLFRRAAPVSRIELARGDAIAPPESIAIDQVLEHALRHLAWLFTDDAAVFQALSDWAEILQDYNPEPFRALG